MKRLAFAATAYIIDSDGVSVYTENLLREIILSDDFQNAEISVDLYIPESAKEIFLKRVLEKKGDISSLNVISVKDGSSFIKAIDLQMKLFVKRGYDLVFVPNPAPLFYGGRKRVKVVHDLTIKRTPELFSALKHGYIDILIRSMYYFDDAIGYISAQTKDDISSFYGIDERKKKMILLPNGIPFKVRQNKRAEFEDTFVKYEEKSIDFIVVGRINRSKGFDRVLKFLNYFDRFLQSGEFEDVRVHVVGKQTDETKSILQECAFENIELIFHGFVDDERLNTLYRKSHFCFFLSRNEGYGLPLVESIYYGCIAIVSNIVVFNEILTSSYPKFDDKTGYEKAIADFVVRIRNDKNYLRSILLQIDEVVKKEKEGYKRAAFNLLEYLHTS